MMRRLARLLCYLGPLAPDWHDLYIIRLEHPVTHPVGCQRCDQRWSLHDLAAVFVDWDNVHREDQP